MTIGEQPLWNPYKPARSNEKAKCRDGCHGSSWGWSKPYDTNFFGEELGCVDHQGTPIRSCTSRRYQISPPHGPASTCKVCRPELRSTERHEVLPVPQNTDQGAEGMSVQMTSM